MRHTRCVVTLVLFLTRFTKEKNSTEVDPTLSPINVLSYVRNRIPYIHYYYYHLCPVGSTRKHT